MILDLTIENLLKSGLNIQDATELFNTTNTHVLQCNSGNFYVSKTENKFYTEIDFYRITYFYNGSLSFPIRCVDLVPEYFDLALNEFLEKQKTILGILYNETEQFKKFISNEIESSQISIENYKALIKKVGSWRLNNKENDIQIRESYINYLKVKQHNAPALNSDTAPTEKYLGQPTNKKANDFFDFLIEYYRPEDKTQIKYVNILHYLKNDADKEHFIFKVKQADYKILVENKTGIKISKFDTSVKYPEEEKPIFHSLENTFLKNKTV